MNHKVITLFLVTVFLLNICDAIFTWLSVTGGGAFEINPIANYLLSKGPLAFFGIKISAVSAALLYVYIRTLNSEVSRTQVIVFTSVAAAMLLVVMLGMTGTLLTLI